MRVALDAFGSDGRPEPEIGAVALAVEGGLEIDLVGARERLVGRVPELPSVRVIDAAAEIGMDESPARAVRSKPNSSLVVAMARLAAGEVGAVVSAGNSGAILTAALLGLGRLSGIDRPAIVTRFPRVEGSTVVLDSGANVDCRPLNLVQFAVMGAAFATLEHKCERPRVALLSNGSEPGKGSSLTRAAAKLLDGHPSDYFVFTGYVEPGELFEGSCDVAITDGWTGNLVLKAAEGAMAAWPRFVTRSSTPVAELVEVIAAVEADVDPDAHGGALLVGVDGTVIICHGGASSRGLYNALRLGQRSSTRGLIPSLRTAIAAHRPLFEAARGS